MTVCRPKIVRFMLPLMLLIVFPAGAHAAPELVGQADLPANLPCPYPGGAGPFVNTGIEVALHTKAGAVLITAQVDITLSPNAGFLIRPTIDGAPADSAFAATSSARRRERGPR